MGTAEQMIVCHRKRAGRARHRERALLASAVGAALLWGGDVAAQPPAPAVQLVTRVPALVDVTAHGPEDQGVVAIGSRIMRGVSLRNKAGQPIRLSVVRKTCSCTEATFDRSTLQPGESATLLLVVLVLESATQSRQTVEIEALTIGSAQPPTRERYTASISYMPDFQLLAIPAWRVVQARSGQPLRAELTVRRRPSLAAKPADPSCTIDGLHVRGPIPMEGIADTDRFIVEGSVNSLGLFNGMVRLTTNSLIKPTLEIPIAVRIEAPWTASPLGIVLGGGSPLAATIMLNRADINAPPPNEITIEPGALGVSASLSGQAGLEPTITVAVDPVVVARSGTVLLHARSKNGTILAEIPVSWLGIEKPK